MILDSQFTQTWISKFLLLFPELDDMCYSIYYLVHILPPFPGKSLIFPGAQCPIWHRHSPCPYLSPASASTFRGHVYFYYLLLDCCSTTFPQAKLITNKSDITNCLSFRTFLMKFLSINFLRQFLQFWGPCQCAKNIKY